MHPPPHLLLLLLNIGSYDKRRGVKSGHEPLFPMTAESAGNFSCAATRNDCNVSADAGMSCYSPISSWWQEGETHSSSLSLLTPSFLLVLQLERCVLWWWRTFKKKKEKEAKSRCKWRVIKSALLGNTRTQSAVWGVWPRVSAGANGKASSPAVCVCVCVCMCVYVCAPARVFSGMAAQQTAARYGFDFVARSTAVGDTEVWENTREWRWTHAQESKIIH